MWQIFCFQDRVVKLIMSVYSSFSPVNVLGILITIIIVEFTELILWH